MTREDLIELGRKIVNCKGAEKEIDEMYELFSRNVPHPSGANLLFYPENYNARKDLSKYKPSIEDVVDKALNYKPFQL